MQQVENERTGNTIPLPVQDLENPKNNNWKGHKVSLWTAKQKLLEVGAGVITFTAIAATLAMNAYTYSQNKEIKEIACHINEEIDGVLRNIDYYKNAAEKGKAADQYCLAEILEGKKELGEARKWYKKAIDQGLIFAKERLCRPGMFEEKFLYGTGYFNFRSICCPDSSSYNPNDRCPWYEDWIEQAR
jgi:TPR repeat protein